METLENNKLIAEFMGLGIQSFFVESPVNGEYIPDDELQYHSSWDWLMPVVEKIGSLGHTMIDIGIRHCIITPVLYSLSDDAMKFYPKINSNAKPMKECIYTAVVEFINWYNSSKEKV